MGGASVKRMAPLHLLQDKTNLKKELNAAIAQNTGQQPAMGKLQASLSKLKESPQ